jgi:hypothetical protein
MTLSIKKITMAVASVAMIGGVAFSVVSNNDFSPRDTPVQASSSISDTVYLELNSNLWGSASAYYTIHYWGGSDGSVWPGVAFNGNAAASGNVVISATWDTDSTHCIILRWAESGHTTEWHRWNYFDANSFTAGAYNYFKNDGLTSCASSLVYENTGTVYFGNSSSWTDVYAYVFHPDYSGILSLGVWPGTKITDISNDITFDGLGLYRISLNKVLGNKIIFNNNSGSQTANLTLVLDGYYKANYESTGDGERGAAADFVYSLNTTLKAVSASGEIKEDSICGISQVTAASICTSYNALSATAKGHVNAATIYTYTDQNSSEVDKHVSVEDIMERLSVMGNTPLS